MADLDRPDFRRRIATLFRTHPMVGILGPRQCGKTTLARDHLAARPEPHVHYFDLEDADHLNRLADPKLALEGLEGLIVIDEVQRSPELFALDLDRLTVVYPGEGTYPLTDRIRVAGLGALAGLVDADAS